MINKYFIGALVVASMGMTSCLKHDSENLAAAGSSVVEFDNISVPESYTSGTKYGAYDLALVSDHDTVSFDFVIDYAGPVYNAPQDILVNVGWAQDTVLNYYNDTTSAGYLFPDTNNVVFPHQVVIKKGTHSVKGHVTVNGTNGMEFGQGYGLALNISSVSYGVISGNYNNVIFVVTLQNQYAGTYATTGYLFRQGGSRSFSGDDAVTTSGAFTLTFPCADLSGSGYNFRATMPNDGITATTGPITAFTPTGAGASANLGLMDADDPGNVGAVSPGWVAGTNSPGTAPWVESVYNNSYEASSGTFWFHMGYNGSNENVYTRQIYQKMVKE